MKSKEGEGNTKIVNMTYQALQSWNELQVFEGQKEVHVDRVSRVRTL